MKKQNLTFYLTVFIMLFSIRVVAQDGTLDTTFGDGGILPVNFDINHLEEQINLPDGKILILVNKFTVGIRRQYSLLKYNEDGSLDNTFGEGGIANLPFDYDNPDSMYIRYMDIGVSSDGKILVTQAKDIARQVDIVPPYDSLFSRTISSILRCNPNGSVDTEFGDNGLITLYDQDTIAANRIFQTVVYSILVKSDNSFLVQTKHNIDVFQLEGFLANGERNTAFGESGNIYLRDQSRVVEAMDDGCFIIDLIGDDNPQFEIRKYFNNGLQDLSYGTSGIATIPLDFLPGGSGYLESAVSENNDLFLLFKTYNSESHEEATVIKIFAEGAIDYSFGTEGKKEISYEDFGMPEAELFPGNILKMPHDIIVSGSFQIINAETNGFFVAKLLENGSYNPSFGNNGCVYNLLGYVRSNIYPNSISVLKNDFKIQTAYHTPSDSLFLLRYNNIPSHVSLRVSGDVSGTWNVDTVYVDGDITIPQDQSLTIMPGTVVYFMDWYKFDVHGQLIAEGTDDSQIIFDAPEEVVWHGIRFNHTDETNQPVSKIKNCLFTKVGGGSWTNPGWNALYFLHSTASVSDSKIFQSGNQLNYSISLVNSGGVILNTEFFNVSPVYIDSSSALSFTNCRFDSSGISIYNSSPRIDSCMIEHSYNGSDIVGIYGYNSSPVITNTIIRNNGDGGVAFSNSSPVFKYVTIEDNHKSIYGGGGYFSSSNVVMKNVIVKANSVVQTGAGLYFTAPATGENFTATLDNCLIVGNSVTYEYDAGGSGVIFTGNYTGKFTNCTIADNTGKTWAGVMLDGTSSAYLINSIVWNNGNNLDFQAGGLYTYSLIQGNYAGMDTSTTNLWNLDPAFRDANNADYHLQAKSCGYSQDSPAIDAGHPDSVDARLDCSEGLGERRADIGFYGGRYSDILVDVEDEIFEEVPSDYYLAQNYPNPFNPTTTINYSIPMLETQNFASPQKVINITLKVYDLLGREVATLVNQKQAPGNYSVQFDASKLSSGIYFYRLQSGSFIVTKKMILMK